MILICLVERRDHLFRAERIGDDSEELTREVEHDCRVALGVQFRLDSMAL